MGRKKFTASAEQLVPDPRYNSKLVSKFINCFMWDGKKSIIQGVFYDAMDAIEKKITDASPLEVFQKAIENVKPMIEVRSKRVGGSNYQVPMPVNRNMRHLVMLRNVGWFCRMASTWTSSSRRRTDAPSCAANLACPMTRSLSALWLGMTR